MMTNGISKIKKMRKTRQKVAMKKTNGDVVWPRMNMKIFVSAGFLTSHRERTILYLENVFRISSYYKTLLSTTF